MWLAILEMHPYSIVFSLRVHTIFVTKAHESAVNMAGPLLLFWFSPFQFYFSNLSIWRGSPIFLILRSHIAVYLILFFFTFGLWQLCFVRPVILSLQGFRQALFDLQQKCGPVFTTLLSESRDNDSWCSTCVLSKGQSWFLTSGGC